MLSCKIWENSGNRNIKKTQNLALQIHLLFQALELLCRIRIKASAVVISTEVGNKVQLLMEWALIEGSIIFLCECICTHFFYLFASCGQIEFFAFFKPLLVRESRQNIFIPIGYRVLYFLEKIFCPLDPTWIFFLLC